MDFRQQADVVAERVSAAYQRRGSIDALYCNDLTLEALLAYAQRSGRRAAADYVFTVMDKRGYTSSKPIPWKKQPFCHIEYPLYQFTKNEAYLNPFIAESENYFRDGERSADGLMVHVCEPKPQGAVLIDSMHDYCSRMAQCAQLNGNHRMATDCVDQFQKHYQLLRYKDTALWRQGRGWLDDADAVSPGTWSRGQGWIIRGLVESCLALPTGSPEQGALKTILNDLAGELIQRQADDGMWHILPHRAPEESYADCSGTGLIIYYFALAVQNNLLTDHIY